MGTQTQTTTRTEADSVIQSTLELGRAQDVNQSGCAPAVILPVGKRIESLTDLREQEEEWKTRRIRGTATLTRPPSFVSHVKRHASDDSALFVTREAIQAVYDYHSPAAPFALDEGAETVLLSGDARHCDHKAVYAWPLSEAWKTWAGAWCGKRLTSVELGELLEDRIVDILDPRSPELFPSTQETVQLLGLTLGSASDLLAVAKEFRVAVKRDIAAAHNTDTGEVLIEYAETHTDARGKKGVTVPTGLLLAIPVHEDGHAFQVVVRLRYTIQDARVIWTLKAHAVDEVVRVATEHQVETIHEQLPGVPLFWGAPER